MNNSKGISYYILWLIGACLLVYYSSSFFAMMGNKGTILYKMDNMLLANILYAFAFGIYLSLLNGLPGRRKMNKPLFFGVFLPCLLILIYPMAVTYLKQIYVEEYFKIVREREFFFFGLMSGLTLIKSLFASR